MEQPSRFDRFAPGATRQVGRPWFFIVVAVEIAAWLPTLFLWETGPSDLLVDALTNPASLVLLILLQNSQNRGDSAKDARQDEMEHALAEILDHLAARDEDEAAAQRLRGQTDRLRRNADESATMSSAAVRR